METKQYRGGRPEMTDDERSDRKFTVRFSNEEFNRLMQMKSGTQVRNMSTFIRDVCLSKPLPMKTQLDSFQSDALSLLVEIRADMLRVGININQSSKRINSTTDYHDLQRDVNQIAGNMSRLEAQVLHLMGLLSSQLQPSESARHGYPYQ